MKKIISVRTQKKMALIPVFNVFVGFIWLYKYRHYINDQKIWCKSLILEFAIVIPLGLAYMLLSKLFTGYDKICFALNVFAVYFIPFALAQGLIKFQEKILPN